MFTTSLPSPDLTHCNGNSLSSRPRLLDAIQQLSLRLTQFEQRQLKLQADVLANKEAAGQPLEIPQRLTPPTLRSKRFYRDRFAQLNHQVVESSSLSSNDPLDNKCSDNASNQTSVLKPLSLSRSLSMVPLADPLEVVKQLRTFSLFRSNPSTQTDSPQPTLGTTQFINLSSSTSSDDHHPKSADSLEVDLPGVDSPGEWSGLQPTLGSVPVKVFTFGHVSSSNQSLNQPHSMSSIDSDHDCTNTRFLFPKKMDSGVQRRLTDDRVNDCWFPCRSFIQT
eukprot:GHVN01041039.1.p1 GENE.GHVN01041039.1~~GHVN01041039.1.p1  ORF type:complete len:279 (+),score=61.45 GHVN01041039.1:274-1110(+)